MSFQFDEAKSLSIVLFILQKLNGKVDRHKLSKILYFADQKHMCKYGRPIIGDSYIAMSNGPVPSTFYDAIKSITDARYSFNLFRKNLTTFSYFILSDKEPDLDELSESDKECLLESIKENAKLSFSYLTKKSHGTAWSNALPDGRILNKWIAKEGNASKEMLNYLQENYEDNCLVNA